MKRDGTFVGSLTVLVDRELSRCEGRRSNSGPAAGWFSNRFGSLTHLCTQRPKDNPELRERCSAGGEDLAWCQCIHEHGAEAAALPDLLPCEEQTIHSCGEVRRNLNRAMRSGRCSVRKASPNLSGEGADHSFGAADSSEGL